jgi:hypothetical protein
MASVGELCGGSIDPIPCHDGLECFYLAKEDQTLPGICVRIVSDATVSAQDKLETHTPRIAVKGEHCGGFIYNAPECEAGLRCVLDKIPDLGGTCE